MMTKDKWYKRPKGPRLSKSFSSLGEEAQRNLHLDMFPKRHSTFHHANR